MREIFMVQKRFAVCTLCIGPEAEAFKIYSHDSFQKYADKINADFVVIDSPKINYTNTKTINPLKFEKYQVYEILEEYERVLFIDNDILITPHAPNIFLEVPQDKIGGLYEDVAMNEENRRKIIQKIQAHLGDVGWKTGFLN